MKYKYEGLSVSSSWLQGLKNKFLAIRIADNKNNIGIYPYKKYGLRDAIKYFRGSVKIKEIQNYINGG